MAIDRDQLSDDVLALLTDYDNVICVSAETPRELVIQYKNKKVVSKYWKSARQMIEAMKDEFFIEILPLREEHMKTYADLEWNLAEDHRDPSDHIIISHAITEKIPCVDNEIDKKLIKERKSKISNKLKYIIKTPKIKKRKRKKNIKK